VIEDKSTECDPFRFCDASALPDGSGSGQSEKAAPPNITVRPSAWPYKAINDLRALIDKACGRAVSCSCYCPSCSLLCCTLLH